MFKFNFNESEDHKTHDKSTSDSNVTWLESKELIPRENFDFPNLDAVKYNEFRCNTNNMIIKHLTSDMLVKKMKEHHQENSIIYAEQNHSDLVKGVYEGGLKVWECTEDLINFITDNELNLLNRKVLDLGCGIGIIGIFSLLKGAEVYFQDYNLEVINLATIPNVLLNIGNIGKNKSIRDVSKYYCGDWESFSDIMKRNNIKFDYIFTSETIYNEENYSKLHAVFEICLENDGIIYLAAKTYYFGVGGGLRSFEDFIKSKGLFDFQRVWICSDGINREILRLMWK